MRLFFFLLLFFCTAAAAEEDLQMQKFSRYHSIEKINAYDSRTNGDVLAFTNEHFDNENMQENLTTLLEAERKNVTKRTRSALMPISLLCSREFDPSFCVAFMGIVRRAINDQEIRPFHA